MEYRVIASDVPQLARVNVRRVLSDKLVELEVRAETLHQGSEQFQVQDD